VQACAYEAANSPAATANRHTETTASNSGNDMAEVTRDPVQLEMGPLGEKVERGQAETKEKDLRWKQHRKEAKRMEKMTLIERVEEKMIHSLPFSRASMSTTSRRRASPIGSPFSTWSCTCRSWCILSFPAR